MSNSTGNGDMPNFDLEQAINDKTNLLLIKKNLTELHALVQLFDRFGSHITAVSNKRDALFVLKKGEYDFIINDTHVLDLNNKHIYQMIQKHSLAKPSLLIEPDSFEEAYRKCFHFS